MADRPIDYPEWASSNVQDPISQQWNVVVPPLEKKTDGYFLGEKPNRQWLNYEFRTINDWIVYLDEMLGASTTSTSFTPLWDGLTNQPTVNNCYYSVIGDKVFINGNIQWAGNADNTLFKMTNLPFKAKNITDFQQCLQLERGTGTTMPSNTVLYANTNANTTNLLLRQTDLATGVSTDITVKGATGWLRFSGFYIREIP